MSDFEEKIIIKINELKEELKKLKDCGDDNPEQIEKIKEKFKILNEQIEEHKLHNRSLEDISKDVKNAQNEFVELQEALLFSNDEEIMGIFNRFGEMKVLFDKLNDEIQDRITEDVTMISSDNKTLPTNPPVLLKSHPPPPLYVKSEKIKELEVKLDKLKHDYLLFRSYLVKSTPKHIPALLSKMSEIVSEYNNVERELGIEMNKEKKKINFPKPPSTPPPSNSISNAFYNEYSSIKTTMKNNADKYNEIMKEIQIDSNNYVKYKDTLKSLEESTNILEERLQHLSSSNNPTMTTTTKTLQLSLPIVNNENDALTGYDSIIKDYHNIKLKLNSCTEDDKEQKEEYQKQLKEIENLINKMNENNSEEEDDDEILSEKLFKDLIVNATNGYTLTNDSTNSEVINYLENYYKNHVPSRYLNDKLFMNYYIKASFDIITKSKEKV